MARKPPEPEELAALDLDAVRALSPEVIKELTTRHYEAMSEGQIQAMFPPVYIGPTWQRNEAGKWLLPDKTLGWEIAGWCAEWLQHDDRRPWRFTSEQLRWILHWYAVDCNGRFINRTGVLQRLKGWGKDPLVAVLCLVELVGPSRFSHWDEAGQPVGKPHPSAWVQVAAVSRDQTRNTMTLFPSLMTDAFKAKYNVEPNIELIRANGGRQRLEAVTSNYRSLEGGRTTFTVLNETHHWVEGNQGIKMYETIDGNATKGDNRYLAITNAYLPGEDSVAEIMREEHDKIRDGLAVDTGLMYDSLEAHSATPVNRAVLPAILKLIRGDAVWLNITSIISSMSKTSIKVARSRRMWLNQIVAEEDALYGPEQWDALQLVDAVLNAGDEIVLGFDGGKTDDSTALVAIRVKDRMAFLLHLWEKPDGELGEGWQIDAEAVSRVVDETFTLYSVQGFYADVALWESYIAQWEREHGETLAVKAPDSKGGIGWDMRRSLKVVTLAHERLMRDVFDGKLRHNGDRFLRRHALNARKASNNYGWSFRKESRESPKKVDAYAALLLAFECLHDLTSRTKKVRQRTGRGWAL